MAESESRKKYGCAQMRHINCDTVFRLLLCRASFNITARGEGHSHFATFITESCMAEMLILCKR